MENKEKFELTKIKTFTEILKEELDKYWDKNYPCRGYLDVETDIYEGSLEPIKETMLRFIDYISENVDADYTIVRDEKTEQLSKGHVEVYCNRSQFDEFKKLIK